MRSSPSSPVTSFSARSSSSRPEANGRCLDEVVVLAHAVSGRGSISPRRVSPARPFRTGWRLLFRRLRDLRIDPFRCSDQLRFLRSAVCRTRQAVPSRRYVMMCIPLMNFGRVARIVLVASPIVAMLAPLPPSPSVPDRALGEPSPCLLWFVTLGRSRGAQAGSSSCRVW